MKALTLNPVEVADLPTPHARPILAIQVLPTRGGLFLATVSLFYTLDVGALIIGQLGVFSNDQNVDTTVAGGSDEGVEGPLFYEVPGSPLVITGFDQVADAAIEGQQQQTPGVNSLTLAGFVRAPQARKSVLFFGVDGGGASLSAVFATFGAVEQDEG